MRFAVIAAGEGSRLAQEGVEQPKPLVSVCGKPMIERLLRIFVDCGATEIVVIVNEWSTAVREHLETLSLPVPLRLVVKTTPSSMHSLHALSPYLRGEKFCLTTVDTIFREEEFKKYIRHFMAATDIDGCMAVTPFVDDEKPLWVGVNEHAETEGTSLIDRQGTLRFPRITGFHDRQEGDDHFISGGIYCLSDKALDVLDHCMEQGMSRMRNFQRQLVAEGLKLEAYPINKILDVDHKTDIAKAEAFLRPLLGKKLVGVCRGNEYSPNCVDNDAAIMNAVKANLETLGAEVEMCNEKNFCQKAETVETALQCGTAHETADTKVDAFFSMARSQRALDALDRIEQNGKVVVNSSRGVKRCVRRTMTEMLAEGGVTCPDSQIIEQGETMPTGVSYPCWLKRGDGCAQQKEDTCYVQSPEEAEKLLSDFWQRGVTSVVINEHLCGDLIKFYGVEGTDFFYWFYPSKCGHRSKFGLEVINGDARGIAFDTDLLKREADKAALMLEVPVYGGDCIVGNDGSLKIIDFNDWPSFAPCRDEAAFYIAMAILNNYNVRNGKL